ncbi:MAG TPA: hypothetical protein VFC26_07655 [Verrucomicrobiae bacterium]|nr:hypothetical protein [Verrucomicrobiae bacterium]
MENTDRGMFVIVTANRTGFVFANVVVVMTVIMIVMIVCFAAAA